MKERVEKDPRIEVSSHSIFGLTSPKTTRLRGFIETQEVITLIGPGTTRNFISSTLVNKLELPIIDTIVYRITMGVRDKVNH